MNIKYYIQHPKGFVISLVEKFNFLFPEKTYLKILFRLRMGQKLDLKDPQTFSEKLQWLKLYNREPEYRRMVDKYEVKEYVKDIIGEDYIIPTLGIWDTFEDIDFDRLPNKFVLKTTNGGGGTGVVICVNKNRLDFKKAQLKLEKSAKINIYKMLREWPYKNIRSRFIAEELIENENGCDLSDYKFFCFNGVPQYCQVISNRDIEKSIDFYDKDWIHQDFHEPAEFSFSQKVQDKPLNYELMWELSRKLAKNMPFVRIDFYNQNGKIYFGEITFFPTSGLGGFSPKEWDLKFGELIKLPNK